MREGDEEEKKQSAVPDRQVATDVWHVELGGRSSAAVGNGLSGTLRRRALLVLVLGEAQLVHGPPLRRQRRRVPIDVTVAAAVNFMANVAADSALLLMLLLFLLLLLLLRRVPLKHALQRRWLDHGALCKQRWRCVSGHLFRIVIIRQ